MTGISSCWRHHRSQDYGKDGLVVLCAITKETVPSTSDSRMTQQYLTQSLERRLLDHYLFDDPGRGVVNKTIPTKSLAEHYHAYGLYIAFTYEEARPEDEIENDWLLGDSPPYSNSPPDPTLLDSPRPNEVQNEPNDFPREENET